MALTVITPATNFRLTELDTLKDLLGITGTEDDQKLIKFIDRASSAVASYCWRVFPMQTYRETLSGYDHPLLDLAMTPVLSITSVKFQGSAITPTDVVIEDRWAGIVRRTTGFDWVTSMHVGLNSYPQHHGESPDWELEYGAGFKLPGESVGAGEVALPGEIEEAVLSTITDWWTRRGQSSDIQSMRTGDGFGVTYSDPGGAGGGEVRMEIPPRARGMLRHWVRIDGVLP